MSEDQDKIKLIESEELEDQELPQGITYSEVVDAPQSLQELDPQSSQSLETIQADFDNLGDLAYEDLVDTLHIAAQAVTNAKIAVDAIQGDVIAASAITAVKISDGAIEAAKIASGAVVAGKIAANAVTANEIAANAVVAGKIAANAVVAASIAAGAIDGKVITGATIRTASTGKRILLDNGEAIQFLYNSSIRGQIYTIDDSGGAGTGPYGIGFETAGGAYMIMDDYLRTLSIGYGTGAAVVCWDDSLLYLAGGGGEIHLIDGNTYVEGRLYAESLFTLASLPASGEGSLPAGNGGMYYDSTNNRIRVNINGTWRTLSWS
jgi:hypothetical protein